MTKEIVDPFTGELFTPRTPNHYEAVDSTPLAPEVTLPRKTLRERIESMLYTPEPPPGYEYEEEDPTDWEDDDGEPLTPAEQAYLDQNAAIERMEAARHAPQEPGSPLEDAAAPPTPVPPSDGPIPPPSPAAADVRPQPSPPSPSAGQRPPKHST